MKTKFASSVALFLAAIIWGFAFVAQVRGTEYLSPFTMVGVRFAISTLALIPVVLFFERGRVSKEECRYTFKASIITGSVLFAASTIQQFGIAMTKSAGVSGFITGLYIIFVPVAYFLFFRKKTGIQVWIGAICAIVGLFLLCFKSGEGFSFGIGETLLLIGSFFWTAHVMLIDHFGKKVRSLHYSWGQFAVCATLGLAAMLIFDFGKLNLSLLWDAKWVLLYLGLLSSGGGYTLQTIGQKNSDPTYAVIILSTESAFSAIGGAIFGTDGMTWVGYVGCLIMFLGIICSQVNIPKSKK